MSIIKVDYGELTGGDADFSTLATNATHQLKKNDVYISGGWHSSCQKPPSGTYNVIVNITGTFICQITEDTSVTLPETSVKYYLLRGVGEITIN